MEYLFFLQKISEVYDEIDNETNKYNFLSMLILVFVVGIPVSTVHLELSTTKVKGGLGSYTKINQFFSCPLCLSELLHCVSFRPSNPLQVCICATFPHLFTQCPKWVLLGLFSCKGD